MKLSHGRLHLSISRCSGAWGSESSSFVIQRMTFLGQADEVVSCEKASGTRMGTPYHLISLGNQSCLHTAQICYFQGCSSKGFQYPVYTLVSCYILLDEGEMGCIHHSCLISLIDKLIDLRYFSPEVLKVFRP